MKKIIRIDLLSHAHHLNQPLTGWHLWAKRHNMKISICDCTQSKEYKIKKTAFVVFFNDHRLVYDMADGYQSPNAMEYLLGQCDAYFKRSFSQPINLKMKYSNVYPYGLNYNITWLGNPLLRRRKGGLLHYCWELINGTLTLPRTIEAVPSNIHCNPRVLYMVRLWPEEKSLSARENEERRRFNDLRIRLLEKLKKQFGEHFTGGLEDSEIARKLAPNLILPMSRTNRNTYIRTMKKADVCIGTTGLHGSIGWKLGEYVAAARSIISEPLNYSVPGEFVPNRNYLEFTSVDQCIEQAAWLIRHPEKIELMQRNNYEYYQNFLQPERLIHNTLAAVGLGGE